MSDFEPFRCSQCFEWVQLETRVDLEWEYRRGVRLHYPESVPVPSCPKCHEVYLDAALEEVIQGALRPEFIEYQKRHVRMLVDSLQQAHNVSQATIESVCGLTTTYLSHLLAGRREASQTLLNLLEAYVMDGGEFLRKLHGRPIHQACVVAMQAPHRKANLGFVSLVKWHSETSLCRDSTQAARDDNTPGEIRLRSAAEEAA